MKITAKKLNKSHVMAWPFVGKTALTLAFVAVSMRSIRQGMWLQPFMAGRSLEKAVIPFRVSLEQISPSRQPEEPPQYLIDMARTRSLSVRAKVGGMSPEEIAFNYSAFLPSDTAFAPLDEWKGSHFSDINIIGLPKAGTSHLYNLLVNHPKFSRFHPTTKETCMFVPSANVNAPTKEEFYTFNKNDTGFEELSKPSAAAQANNTLWPTSTVNGCLQTKSVMMMRQYLQRLDDSKIIFLLRDPADWSWAAYNFWRRSEHIDALPSGGPEKSWTHSSTQYRSPEHFHEMLKGGNRLWTFVELFSRLRDAAAYGTASIVAAAKQNNPQNVLVLKTEDMAPDRVESSGFLKKLADFLEVSVDSFDESILKTFSNCGDKRGVNSQCKTSSSAYAIAGNRSMLEESRELVYLHFAEECKLWAEELEVVYENCMAVRKKFNLGSYYPS